MRDHGQAAVLGVVDVQLEPPLPRAALPPAVRAVLLRLEHVQLTPINTVYAKRSRIIRVLLHLQEVLLPDLVADVVLVLALVAAAVAQDGRHLLLHQHLVQLGQFLYQLIS